MLSDFITFKTMIIPKLITFLYVVLTIAGLVLMFIGKFGNGQDQFSVMLDGMPPLVFLIIIILIPFAFHVVFEYLMLPFAILAILRETRNAVIKQNDQLTTMQKE